MVQVKDNGFSLVQAAGCSPQVRPRGWLLPEFPPLFWLLLPPPLYALHLPAPSTHSPPPNPWGRVEVGRDLNCFAKKRNHRMFALTEFEAPSPGARAFGGWGHLGRPQEGWSRGRRERCCP